jgi:hypothetical protein
VSLEYGPQLYIPRAKIRLICRMEEFDGSLALAAPRKLSTQIKGVKDDRNPLVVQRDPEAPAGVTRFLLLPEGQSPGSTSLQTPGNLQLQSSDGLTAEIGGVVPRKANWKQNGLRTADTLACELRWIDLPLYPLVFRSIAVEFYLGTITSQEAALGSRGETRSSTFGDGTPRSRVPLDLVRDTWLDARGNQRSNLRFQGWVDRMRSTWSGDAEAVLRIECTDNTRLLIKQTAAPKHSVGKDKPIDEAVAEYLSHYPRFAGLTVEYRPTEVRDVDTPPRLGKILRGTAFSPYLGPPVAKGGGAQGQEKLSVWDYLTDVCGAIGHSIRIKGTRLIIQRPSTIVDGEARAREDDPHKGGRSLPSGRYPVRAFIFGRNILELEADREFSLLEPKNIEVRSYDPVRKTVLVARFPEKPDRATTAGPGDDKADQEWHVIHADEIGDLPTLKKFAEDAYNGLNRNELLMGIKTRNLASFGGDNEDPDVLDLEEGDTVEIGVDREPTFSTIAARESDLTSEALNQRLLQDLGFSSAFAAAYAKTYTSTFLQRLFRLKTMGVDWSTDEGVTLELGAINYVESRLDKPSDATKAARDPNVPPGTPRVGSATQGVQPAPQNVAANAQAQEKTIKANQFRSAGERLILGSILGPHGIILGKD